MTNRKKQLTKPKEYPKIITYIAAAAGLIMFGFGLSYTYWSMQTPMKEKLKETESRLNDACKETENNKDMIKLKDKEIDNLKNKLEIKDKDNENIKKQLEKVVQENNKNQDKLNQKQLEVDRLTRTLNQTKKDPQKPSHIEKKKDPELTDKIPTNEETVEHLNTFERHREGNSYDFDIWYVPINESKSFFSGEINVTLINLDKNNKITAKISSPGNSDTPIYNGFVGQSIPYNSKDKDYNIHIAKLYNNNKYSWVKFTIKKIRHN